MQKSNWWALNSPFEMLLKKWKQPYVERWHTNKTLLKLIISIFDVIPSSSLVAKK